MSGGATERRALVVGYCGGVGRALLSLLSHSEGGRELAGRFEELVLVDEVLPREPVALAGARMIDPRRIRSSGELLELVRAHGITEVVDLSSLGSFDCARACHALGVSFLSTSIEVWPEQEPIATADGVAPLLPGARPHLPGASFLIGSGMNPGVVNALAMAGLELFAERVGCEATAAALDLYGLYITEEDTTVAVEGTPPGVFAMTWSPKHCLVELFEEEAVVTRAGAVASLGHGPTEAEYRVRCHERVVDAMVVPHEEAITLAVRLPVEIGFLYRLAPAARAALARWPERRDVDGWEVQKLYPPHTRALEGRDAVGVLLCSRTHGELWVGFDTPVELGRRYGTNATELQVASGVLAGWGMLGDRDGIHFVEELDWRAYLRAVEAVLGPAAVVHDPDAPARTLEERRVG